MMAGSRKVLAIVGTRPEGIKMAPVIAELRRHPEAFDTQVCATGQHRQMLDQVLSLFDIQVDMDLNLMEHNQDLPSLTAKALRATTDVIGSVRPDVVLVQGDTTTAMISALAAFYQRIPVGHVEAGLRTHDRYSPFPEEVNRRMISVLTTYHFAPTEKAVATLHREGCPADSVFLTGNTVVDALLHIRDKGLSSRLPFEINGRRLILVTAHRRESFGEPLRNICEALARIAANHPDVEIVYPVHLNPNVHDTVHAILNGRERIRLLPPVEYDILVHLLNRSYLVLTDSGGIQEEAPVFGKPVLVLRKETERPDGIECGVSRLVGTDVEAILRHTELLLRDEREYAKMSRASSPYGDGTASRKIAAILREGCHHSRNHQRMPAE